MVPKENGKQKMRKRQTTKLEVETQTELEDRAKLTTWLFKMFSEMVAF